MEWKRNTTNLPGTLALVCLLALLSACNDKQSSGSGTSSGNLTGVDEIANNGGGNSQVPPTDTDNSTTDPTDPLPDDTTNADPEPTLITLSWQPTPGQIDGYIVHTGPTPETATAVITVTPTTAVEYDASSDLGLDVGDQSCFRIKAYNSEGQSGYSDAVCYTVNS